VQRQPHRRLAAGRAGPSGWRRSTAWSKTTSAARSSSRRWPTAASTACFASASGSVPHRTRAIQHEGDVDRRTAAGPGILRRLDADQQRGRTVDNGQRAFPSGGDADGRGVVSRWTVGPETSLVAFLPSSVPSRRRPAVGRRARGRFGARRAWARPSGRRRSGVSWLRLPYRLIRGSRSGYGSRSYRASGHVRRWLIRAIVVRLAVARRVSPQASGTLCAPAHQPVDLVAVPGAGGRRKTSTPPRRRGDAEPTVARGRSDPPRPRRERGRGPIWEGPAPPGPPRATIPRRHRNGIPRPGPLRQAPPVREAERPVHRRPVSFPAPPERTGQSQRVRPEWPSAGFSTRSM
jgi:hypothetical protein